MDFFSKVAILSNGEDISDYLFKSSSVSDITSGNVVENLYDGGNQDYDPHEVKINGDVPEYTHDHHHSKKGNCEIL